MTDRQNTPPKSPRAPGSARAGEQDSTIHVRMLAPPNLRVSTRVRDLSEVDRQSDSRPPSTITVQSIQSAVATAPSAAESRRPTPEPPRPVTRAFVRQQQQQQQQQTDHNYALLGLGLGGGISLPVGNQTSRGIKRPRSLDDVLNDKTMPARDEMTEELDNIERGRGGSPTGRNNPAAAGPSKHPQALGQDVDRPSQPSDDHEAKKMRRAIPIHSVKTLRKRNHGAVTGEPPDDDAKSDEQKGSPSTGRSRSSNDDDKTT